MIKSVQIFGRLCFYIFALFPMGSISAQEITYESIVFLGENHGNGSDGNTWTQLPFRVEGFRIDGSCYVQCRFAFTLGSNIGRYEDRSDIGVRPYASWLGGATVVSDLPFDQYNQIFIGANIGQSSYREIVEALSDRERLAIAWIAAHSEELIKYALSDGIAYQPARSLWQRRAANFEPQLLNSLADGLIGSSARRFTRLVNSREDLADTVQPALQEMGLYSAEIDGLSGPATRRAVEAFQRDNRRLESGYVDATEMALLHDYLLERGSETNQRQLWQFPQAYDLRDAVEDAVAAQTELRSANARIESLEAELAQAQLERDEFELRLARSLESLGSARQTIERRSQRITELVMERDGLVAQLSTSRVENEVLNQRVMDLEVFARQNSSEASELEAALNQLSAAQDVISELQEVVLRSRQIYSVRGRDCICDARVRQSP